MKIAVFSFLFAGALCAQIIPSSGVSPEIPDQEVIAVFEDGHQFTMAEFRAIFMALDPQQQRAAMNERARWIHQYALFRKLAGMAEKEKLDQMTPVKEIVQFGRMNVLAQMMLGAQANGTTVDGAEIVKAYESNKDKYKQVKLRVIYISFLPESLIKTGSKGLTEAQAKAKAEKLVEQIRKGADFVQLVKANSEDAESRAKDGEFSTMRATDNVPKEIASAVFSLKQSEVTDPIKQPNGFYIFKADDVSVRPLSEVRDDIYTEVKLEKHKRWMEDLDKSVKVQMQSEKFFKPSQPQAPSAGAPSALPKPAVKK